MYICSNSPMWTKGTGKKMKINNIHAQSRLSMHSLPPPPTPKWICKSLFIDLHTCVYRWMSKCLSAYMGCLCVYIYMYKHTYMLVTISYDVSFIFFPECDEHNNFSLLLNILQTRGWREKKLMPDSILQGVRYPKSFLNDSASCLSAI